MRYGLRDFCARDIDGFSLNAAFSVASSGSGSGGGSPAEAAPSSEDSKCCSPGLPDDWNTMQRISNYIYVIIALR